VGSAVDFRIGFVLSPSRGESLSAVGTVSSIKFLLFLSGPGTLILLYQYEAEDGAAARRKSEGGNGTSKEVSHFFLPLQVGKGRGIIRGCALESCALGMLQDA